MQMEETVQGPHVPVPIEVQPNNSFVNILLLGPTGVGKSTFINALCNYITYRSLEEALQGGVRSPIYSEFSSSAAVGDDGEYVSKRITVGEPDDLERAADGNRFSSCTQSCKAYVFPSGKSLSIRLIDTPGIADTRGGDVDEANMTKVVSFLSQYDVLHAICILLKPNEVRLTTSLKYSIIKLLEKLHKDASANILFCFTNSRNTNFKPGETLGLLQSMLHPKRNSADNVSLKIGLKVDTMYFFDSEAFRFQAMRKHGMAFTLQEEEEYKLSWERSNMEADRLIMHIRSLEPHRIKETLSLNRVRSMLESIQKPLGAITGNIQKNLQETREVKKFLKENQGAISGCVDKLLIEEEFQETFPLSHPRTVCNQPQCAGKICHDRCSSVEKVFAKAGSRMGSMAKMIGDFVDPRMAGMAKVVGGYMAIADKWVICSKLNPVSGRCSVCDCRNDMHIRMHHEMKTSTRKVEDKEIRKVLEGAKTEAKKKEDVLERLEDKERSLQAENDVVLQAAVHFAAFLEQNSIVTYHSAVPHYYKEQIKLMRAEGNQGRVAELEAVLESYKNKADEYKQRLHKSKDPNFNGFELVTEKTVEQHLQQLYGLPLHGPSLKKWIDGIESEFSVAFRRGEVICNAPVARTDHAASAPDGSRLTSLFARITPSR